jgi:predicted nucleotidyltransferase
MTDPVERARQFTTELAELYGENLRSVLVYGSVVRGEAVEGVSDINLLILLDRIPVSALAAGSEIGRRWVREGGILPLMLRWEDRWRLTDVFPIEVADVMDHRTVLHGEDPLPGLRINRVALRHQTEHELRARLHRLRADLLIAAPDPLYVGALLTSGLPRFGAYLRAILRLDGREVPTPTPDVVRAAAPVIGAEPDGMLEAWRARSAGQRLSVAADDPVVASYYALVERAVDWVDALSVQDLTGMNRQTDR